MDYSKEEIEKMLEESKAKLQEALDKMTPEERKQAELKAREVIKEDQESISRLIEDAAKYASSPDKEMPNFCSNCGAKAGGGNFCEYCGAPLSK